MKSPFWRTARLVLRIVLGGAFVYAAVPKIIHPDQFAEILIDYNALPMAYLNLIAVWLPYFELLVGLLVLLGAWQRASALAMAGMMGLFIVGIAWALHRGIALHCGCFSTDTGGEARTWTSLWQECMTAGMAVVLWVGSWERPVARPAPRM